MKKNSPAAESWSKRSEASYADVRHNIGGYNVQEFRDESATLFSKAMAQTRMAVILADAHLPDMPIVFANKAFSELTGYSPEEILGRNCRFLQGPQTDPAAVARMRTALQDEDVIVLEILNYRKSGESFWNALHLGPLYDEQGNLQYYFGSQWDVSNVHAARENEEHAKILARELSHRVKNMFSIVSSVVSMTAERHDAHAVAEDINDRIFALGRAYEITLKESSRQEVRLQPLVESVLEPYSSAQEHSLEIGGPNLKIPVTQSATIGLILHELATNAVKYGAFRTNRGTISVDWSVTEEDDERILELTWREQASTPDTPPDHDGSGTGIIQSILDASDGEITREWQAGGLRASIRLPL